MGRRVPLTICFVAGMVMVVQFFIPALQPVYMMVLDWIIVVSVCALVVGIQTLIYFHVSKIRRKSSGFPYSYVTLVALVCMAVIGLAGGIRQGSVFMKLFEYIQVPLGATMFSLLAFFMASAAYRAFRAKTLEATLLLIAAVIVMLGRVPIGYFLTKGLPESLQIPHVTEWILMYPNMAAKRGIMFGVALGMISTALKVIIGIERGYLGGGK